MTVERRRRGSGSSPATRRTSYLMVLVDPKNNTLPGGDSDPDGFDGPIDPNVGGMPYNSPLLCKEKIGAIQPLDRGRRRRRARPDGGMPDAMPADGGVDGGVDVGVDAPAL